MAIKQKDLKLLWGRAASRCTLCRCELAHEGSSTTGTIPIGEQAHIVAEEPGGPRGTSVLTAEERNAYPNLMLLCPTCHTKIDKASADHPIELLHQRKAEHELWVRDRLTESEREDPAVELYAHVVDVTVRLAGLENWEGWTSFALSPEQRWSKEFSDRLFDLAGLVQKALWPGRFLELERSLTTFVWTLAAAFRVFEEHCTGEGDLLVTHRFYKIREWNPELNHKLHEEFKVWQRECDELLREATRAANWFAAVVRRDLDPSFFLLHGKFSLVEGPFSEMQYYQRVYEYEAKVSETLPTDLDARLAHLAPVHCREDHPKDVTS